jgi:HlyD family secretion protein
MNRRTSLALLVLGLFLLVAIATKGFGLTSLGEDGAIKLYGNVDVREVDMAFRVPGRISAIAVEEGEKVSKGQLLAVLDTATLDARIRQADAQLGLAQAELLKLRNGSRPQDIAQARARAAAAEAAFAEADRDYQRRKPLVESGAISRDLWDQTRSTRDKAQAHLAEAQQALSLVEAGPRAEDKAAAQAQMAAAEAARRSAATDLGDSRLVAAQDGVVVTRAREPGAIVQPGETVLTLSIVRPMRVRAYIGEPQLSRISPGMKVLVKADGNARTYHGTIGFIAPKAEFTPKTVETEDLRTDLVYRLRIIVTDPDDGLRQGQPVTVSVPDARPAGR